MTRSAVRTFAGEPGSEPGHDPGAVGAPAHRRHPRRLDVDALERWTRGVLGRAASTPPGVLVIGLARADRARALAGRADAVELTERLLERIERVLRPDDRYAAVAADEVWVVLDRIPGEPQLRLAANALRRALDGFHPGRRDDGTDCRVRVTAAVGGAWVDGPESSLVELADAAGRALVQARGTEDGISLVPLRDERAAARAALEPALRAALASNALQMWYQPQVSTRPTGCRSLEALVRWPSAPPGSASNPALLVSVCEETGLIGDLTGFALRSVLRDLAAWRTRVPGLRVGINLSAHTLEDASFPTAVAQLCELFVVPPSSLLFEITESALARREQASTEFLQRLRAIGCELSIDDFGTGYSSFSYLRHFPVHEIKIDREFVRELVARPQDRRIVAAIIDLAHGLGLRALAEGVEDRATMDVLTGLGIDAVQGWLFAKAMPPQEVPDWLRRFAAAGGASGS
jgi:EAL domain-containing protein (putative c-di-GMP-specific phosphodiesterase class I)